MNEPSIFFDNNESFESLDYDLNSFNYEEEDYFFLNNVPYNLLNKTEQEKSNISQDSKSASTKKNEENNEPELYTSNNILNIFNKESYKDIFSENLKKVKFSEYIEDNLQPTKKRIRSDFNYDNLFLQSNNNSKNDVKKKKRGREAKENNKRETHDKRSPDNIIKKIKAYIFIYTLSFLNDILKKNFRYNNVELLKLDYKYVNNLQKEQDLDFLNMSLKDLFSKEISPKYNKFKYPKDYNKKLIENILKDGNDIILFALKMTLRDWLDLFTLKKSVEDIINKYNNNHTDKENLIKKIGESLIGVDKILNKIDDNSDEDYMARFLLCLYNYERWFHLKKSRDKKKK